MTQLIGHMTIFATVITFDLASATKMVSSSNKLRLSKERWYVADVTEPASVRDAPV